MNVRFIKFYTWVSENYHLCSKT